MTSKTQRRVFVLAIAALVAAIGFWQLVPSAPAFANAPVDRDVKMANGAPASFADVIAAVQPAVVNISVAGPAPGGPRGGAVPFDDFEDFLRRFFDGQGFDSPRGQMPRQAPAPAPEPMFRGMGSGFIVSPDGYVVTNNHVVDHASEIVVTLTNGKQLDARLVGTDEKTDLALVKVESDEELPYARFGDSDATRVGDWVVAIGNPFGLGGSATAGIVSARGRDIQSGPYDDFIQIDAPINQGNSGGPLFDLSGHVIGVNAAIYTPNGGNVGIGFAIPSSMANNVIEQLKTNGVVSRGWLGVTIQPMDERIAEGLGIDSTEGALVASVVDGSPAAKAGLEPGDVIVSVDGEHIDHLKELTRKVAEAGPNEDMAIEVLRDGKSQTLHAHLGTSPDEPVVASNDATTQKPGRLGLSLAPVPEGSDRMGAVVAAVEPGGPAARAGLQPGDVIVTVGRTKVRNVDEALKQIENAKESSQTSVLLRIVRGDQALFVAVPFE